MGRVSQACNAGSITAAGLGSWRFSEIAAWAKGLTNSGNRTDDTKRHRDSKSHRTEAGTGPWKTRKANAARPGN